MSDQSPPHKDHADDRAKKKQEESLLDYVHMLSSCCFFEMS